MEMKRFVCLTVLMALVMMLAGVAVVHAEVLPRYGKGQIGLTAVVLCEELTLRPEPNAASGTVMKLKYGDLIIVDRETDGWAHCFRGDSEDSASGWVNSDYIKIDPEWYRTEAKTPVYAWDNTLSYKVALLDADTTLPILSNQGDWLIVSLRGAVGFIHLN